MCPKTNQPLGSRTRRIRYPILATEKRSNKKIGRRRFTNLESFSFTMHATALRQVFLPLLCLLIGSVLPVAGSTVPHIPASDSLPSAPKPSVVSAPSSSELHPAVIHPGHVTIPRLESEPRLEDFLTGAGRSPAAKQMLRISDFID